MTKKKLNEDSIIKALSLVIDPELGINIVDLGLVYETKVEEGEGSDDLQVRIVMTLTTPGCPLGGWFIENIKDTLSEELKVKQDDILIEIVFDPPWIQEMMSENAKAELGFD